MEAEREPEFRLEDLALMESPGYSFETVCDVARNNEVVMGLQQIWLKPIAEEVYEVVVQTNRGLNEAILTVSQSKPGVVLWIPGGANLNGPAAGVFSELAGDLHDAGINSLRMAYRDQSSFDECVLDALAWLTFLKEIGAKEVVLAGATLGAAVAFPAAVIHPLVKSIIAVTPPQENTEMLEKVHGKPILVVHGERDVRIPVQVARDLFLRAAEPKELVVYPDAGFTLVEAKDELRHKLGKWVSQQLGESEAYAALSEARDAPKPDMVRRLAPEHNGHLRQMVLTMEDMVDMDVGAIVSTTGTWLDLKTTRLASSIMQQGGAEIQDELWAQAPLFVGDVAVTGSGALKAQYVFHAITGGESAAEPLSRDEAVAVTTRASLAQANALGLKTIALPAIGTGGRGFPIEKAGQIMVPIVAAHLASETSLEKVVFSVVSDSAYRSFANQLKLLPE